MSFTIKGMQEVFIEILQSTAFLDVIPIEEKCDTNKDRVAVKMSVLLPYLGNFVLSAERSLANKIVKNLYADVAFEKAYKDVLGEVLNVFVGALFEKEKPNELFELGLPEIHTDFSNCGESCERFALRFVSPDKECISICYKIFDSKE